MTIKPEITLYDYWRSSASYRIRIALALGNIEYIKVKIDLLSGDQKSPEHLKRNPQGLVPALDIDGETLTQSIAIIEYLNTRYDLNLIPSDPLNKAKVMALVYAIAMEIHPVCNLSVASRVAKMSGNDDDKKTWMQHFISKGLSAFENMLTKFPDAKFCAGETPSIADICLVPQMYNADRWGVDCSSFTRILSVMENCNSHPAFIVAYPTS